MLDCLVSSRFVYFMSGLKTLLVLLVLFPMQSRGAEDPLISVFAICAGRYSAELEHAWLMQEKHVSQIEHRRGQFIDLLMAISTADRRSRALHERIDAKFAHAQLLSLAAFSDDVTQSSWAVRRAKSEIAYCEGFLLKS